ncbi:MAG: ATP-binding cassette domain-containing protein [Candidatus Krumholzibacteria bacterium]|nr:ATP-binding cassette domain-containing protein [Candidatus Krumholzibacteria bacterium]
MITVKDLWKTFKLSREQKKEIGSSRGDGTIDAVAGISFDCQPGRVFTLLGPNGAGKTTALRMIATLLKPTRGSIEVAGHDTLREPQEVRRRLGFLTGTTKLYERLTPSELVRYYADLHGMDRLAFEKRREQLFTLLDMNDFAERRIGKLSTGMRQKVSIVRTMIHDPDVLVFDEPTVGLDVITSKHIIELIRSCKEAGKTVIFSTHIMSEVSLLSDDLAIIHNGRFVYNGSYQQFRGTMQERSVEEEFIRRLEGA